MERGKLVVFSGIDGSGKTTQIDLLKNHLNHNYISLKQPSNWYRNHAVVKNYLKSGNLDCSIDLLARLSAIDRLIQIQTEILPELEKGNTVICDRYVYSAYGYFINRGVKKERIKELNKGVVEPDKVIFLKINGTIALNRISKRNKREINFEEKSINSLNEIQLNMLNSLPKKSLILDGSANPELLLENVLNYLYL